MVEHGNHHWGVGMFTIARKAGPGRTIGHRTGRTLSHQAYLAWLAFFTDRPLPAMVPAHAVDDEFDAIFSTRREPPDDG